MKQHAKDMKQHEKDMKQHEKDMKEMEKQNKKLNYTLFIILKTSVKTLVFSVSNFS